MTEPLRTYPLTDAYYDEDNNSQAFRDVRGDVAPPPVVARALALASGGELLLVDVRAAAEESGTTWSVYGLLVGGALLHVRVKRPGDSGWSAYSALGDETKDEVEAAWLRPLATVTTLEATYVDSNARPDSNQWSWSSGAVVCFTDGSALELPGPRRRGSGNGTGVHPIAAAVRRHLLGQEIDPRG